MTADQIQIDFTIFTVFHPFFIMLISLFFIHCLYEISKLNKLKISQEWEITEVIRACYKECLIILEFSNVLSVAVMFCISSYLKMSLMRISLWLRSSLFIWHLSKFWGILILVKLRGYINCKMRCWKFFPKSAHDVRSEFFYFCKVVLAISL